MKTGCSRIWAEIIFIVHFIVFLLFPLGFFIPAKLWPPIIVVHFWYCFILLILFYLWGLLWTLKLKNKIHAICILDTLMQKARGFSLWDPRNYEHSFVEEVFARFHITYLPKRFIPGLLLICIILSGIRYFLLLKGIIIY